MDTPLTPHQEQHSCHETFPDAFCVLQVNQAVCSATHVQLNCKSIWNERLLTNVVVAMLDMNTTQNTSAVAICI